MTQIGCGPFERIDGPPPLQPVHGLLQVAGSTDPVVRINPGGGLDAAQVERWLNGVEVYPYPPGLPHIFDQNQGGSSSGAPKATGEEVPLPQFGPMTVYVAETCTAAGVGDQDDYIARATRTLVATEGAAVEREFLFGAELPLNRFLSDGVDTDLPNGPTATSLMNGIALLENLIGESGRRGIIHMSPAAALAAAAGQILLDSRTQTLRTVNGTVVVPGAGYAAGKEPQGEAAAAGTQEWIYATGPVDLWRTEAFVIPGDVSEALDRATNTITYRAERYWLVDWDTIVHAAVLIDRCMTTCT